MLGVKGSSIRYEAYDSIPGVKEFIDRINDIVATYKTYSVTATATSTGSQPADVSNFWKNGYVSAGHNWGAGSGIRSAGDSRKSDYNPGHIAGCAKTGIAVTALYAVPRNTVGIKDMAVNSRKPIVTCKQTASGTVKITIDAKRKDPTQNLIFLTRTDAVSGVLMLRIQAPELFRLPGIARMIKA